ncbi:MAG TPA: hypothetical protein VFS21_25420 [Roseiflexaceae bacterium]|nr:hypothetical protein [Roseiflexaceae bacterium]
MIRVLFGRLPRWAKLALVAGSVLLGAMVMWEPTWVWWLAEAPPLPPQSRDVRISAEQYSDDGLLQLWHLRSHGHLRPERKTRFSSTLAAAEIQAFYQQELTRRGWRYRCRTTAGEPACGMHELVAPWTVLDAFDQGVAGTDSWYTLEVAIGEGYDGTRSVEVVEFWSPQLALWGLGGTPPPQPANALVGDWQITDPPNGTRFFVRFHEESRVIVWSGQGYRTGIYWPYPDGSIKLLFDAAHYTMEPSGFCDVLPLFLSSVCQEPHQPAQPATYPAPTAESAVTPSVAALILSTPPPYLAPPTPFPTAEPPPYPRSPDDWIVPGIDTVFRVSANGDTLTLTHISSGRVSTLKRIGGS